MAEQVRITQEFNRRIRALGIGQPKEEVVTEPEIKSNPWKSKAQRARCAQLVAEGKMKQEAFDIYEAATPNLNALPERVGDLKKMEIKDAKRNL